MFTCMTCRRMNGRCWGKPRYFAHCAVPNNKEWWKSCSAACRYVQGETRAAATPARGIADDAYNPAHAAACKRSRTHMGADGLQQPHRAQGRAAPALQARCTAFRPHSHKRNAHKPKHGDGLSLLLGRVNGTRGDRGFPGGEATRGANHHHIPTNAGLRTHKLDTKQASFANTRSGRRLVHVRGKHLQTRVGHSICQNIYMIRGHLNRTSKTTPVTNLTTTKHRGGEAGRAHHTIVHTRAVFPGKSNTQVWHAAINSMWE